MATSGVAVVLADTLVGRFVAVAVEVRALRLFGEGFGGAAFFAGALRAAAARLEVAVAAFAAGFADLAGTAVAFLGDLAALVLAAVPDAFAVLRVVADAFAAVLDAGVRVEVADALVDARFVGRAAIAADALVAVVAFTARGVPDRVARPPRPPAAIATPSWSEQRALPAPSQSTTNPAKAAKDTS